MNINKAHWVTEGDSVRLSMPIGKVDVERRTVSGFATLDNVDKQGDIVTTEASLNAFKGFRGNLREMHQPSAVGKVVSFKEDRYFDPSTKKFYSGVYVSAYVSKGAQDAWEKVLDGTYAGFSIGGNIKKYDDQFDDNLDKEIRIIKEYDLHELSLVDNPANQFANIISIEKVDGKNQVDGYLSKMELENVYWCNTEDIVHLSESSDAQCPSCTSSMQNIGFVEKNDADNADTIKFLVDSAKGINTSKMEKEEYPMDEATEVVEETMVEKSEVTPEAHEEAVAETVEKSDETEKAYNGADSMSEDEKSMKDKEKSMKEDKSMHEDEEDEEKTEKATEVVETAEEAPVAKAEDALVDAVSEIQNSLANAFGDLSAVVKALGDDIAELKKSLGVVSQEIETVKGGVDEFGKRVDQVEADTAFRKSGDLGEIVQEPVMVQKSLWGGRFLTNTDLFN
jgi:hypothetical protein